ncbi:hypothetical protein L3Q65_01075 (plasmid) [Amycolatopsis sp. FU40]|uniref:hypothetical protein n=1 Tax=Amycolatopsis sp. FU40 TaxID=2914159 RepID=UPI001F1E0AA6|nr:hypothetical protein [Amycolatopsis sp. FU40]UKD50918.1 hypothetical protein L3Q65_01075 [Amycolatopsis sp. FU40]
MQPENDFASLTIDRGSPPRRQYFVGRWLWEPDVEDGNWPRENDPEPEFARHSADAPAPPEAWRAWIAQTEGRKILVHAHHYCFDTGASEVFGLFDTLAAARASLGGDERIPSVAWDAAEERLRALTAYDEAHLNI